MARPLNTDKPAEDYSWDTGRAQAESTTHLEDDTGHGQAVIIRQFKFSVNPLAFKHNPPSKQELLNHHLKQIEILAVT